MNILLDHEKFQHPAVTAKGDQRAQVEFKRLSTLWLNTGSLCNIECANCYIESSPKADHFAYLTLADIEPYLDEIAALGFGEVEIGITGGEPFLNPHIFDICQAALSRGHSVLILTNAMKPLLRARVQKGLLELQKLYPNRMTIRVSLDHYGPDKHDLERGAGSFDAALAGMNWLSERGFTLNIAGRAAFSESEASARRGFAGLIADQGWAIDADNAGQLLLFPEMDSRADVPEITTVCWDILGISPDNMMCASSRMVVKRKGERAPSVLSCTLLWDDVQFEMGKTLAESLSPVALNHPHCAKFCVLGGASCSA